MVQLDCEVKRNSGIGSGAFSPAPRVEIRDGAAASAVTHHPRPPPDRARFEAIVRSCFSRRRKTLRNALRGFCDEPAIAAAGLDPRARPETLTIDEFVDLAHVCMGTG